MSRNKTFNFPYEAYDIQNAFMSKLYDTIESGKIGIFESPTGTGKSLSLICGTLSWLKDFEERKIKEMEANLQLSSENKKESSSGFDWFDSYSKKHEEQLKLKDDQAKYDRYKKRESRIKKMTDKRTKRIHPEKEENISKFEELFKDIQPDLIKSSMEEDDDLVLDDFNSDDETESKDIDDEDVDEKEEDDDFIVRIYYCSRTHSQLTQFIREVQKTDFAKNIRLTALASRQSTCINDSVTKLKALNLINDQCLHLQKNKKGKATLIDDVNKTVKKKKSSQGCPFYKANHITAVQEEILTKIMDIEQYVRVGKKIKGCPYYASRRAAPDAHLIVLPYNTLLHKSTREANGVRLKNSVVIIDEAHNLTEAIVNIHSVAITGGQVLTTHSQLFQYQQRYKLRLNAKNMLYISQLLFILEALLKVLGINIEKSDSLSCESKSKTSTKLFSPIEFLNTANLDNINLFKIVAFCESSDISKKLYGFIDKYEVKIHIQNKDKRETEIVPKSSVSNYLQKLCQNKTETVTNNVSTEVVVSKDNYIPSSPLNQVKDFLRALTTANADGRIVVTTSENARKSSLKFLLLNPAEHFKEIISDARAIVVAGGTMQPTSEFSDQLFIPAGANRENIVNFSCGHVIPDENLIAIALGNGPSGKELNFSYQNRQSQPEMVEDLGRLLCNISNIIPGGIVCFFPSYDYANLVCNQWNKSKILERIANKKKVFKEPQTSSLCEQILADYAKTIQGCSTESQLTGAILVSVVGGKMSEGINFSDDLGRCVIMIGMPYPNSNSPELKEKMDYLNSTMPKLSTGQTPGQQYYENLCMKAVNQSIGRAIRHRNDYAVILLVDSRYSRPQVQNNLPTWISSQIKNKDTFGAAFATIRKFFSEKKMKN